MDYSGELQIAALIAGHILGALDAERTELLEQWKNKSDENRELFHRLTEDDFRFYPQKEMDKADIEKVIETIYSHIYPVGKPASRKGSGSRRFFRGAAAACVALAVGVAVFFAVRGGEDRAITALNLPDPASKVRIVLPSGQEVRLGDMAESIEIGDGTISRRGAGLVIHSDGMDPAAREEIMTTIVTDQGGEVSFILPDGTSVWLNADSRLSFPAKFRAEDRRVELSGEAYFEVHRNPGHPFIVSTGEMDIRVTGTTFNIKSYPNEPKAVATLLSGSITVDAGGASSKVEPGYAATFGRATGSVEILKADPDAATAWLRGQLMFVDEEIGAVLRTLARWYDVEFVFDGPSPHDYTFNGRISKYDPLFEILGYITLAGGPRFTVEDGTVYVR